ncbi:hypothetical protein ASG31_13465 [Chryseobacterium sp. Leaf404]|uniref:hypothetical protein n=1 Tax=unclassified Chryseobacterium TaxID=2593645 RepID=UPI0006F89E59|nr:MULTISPECIES: hypothetical protein [unclassified Chryseobacterium]KQT16514.1 hypothetical protein ASG31_13465 [Chryseobacterium sp. Leaf404]
MNIINFFNLAHKSFANYKTFIFSIIVFFISSEFYAQSFNSVAIGTVISGSGTSDVLFNATSPTLGSFRVRAQRLSGVDGNFALSGDNIVYNSTSATTGLANNSSVIRFTFLQGSTGNTPINPADLRFVVNDIDGPDNEGLATSCAAGVKYMAVSFSPLTRLTVNTAGILRVNGTANESDGIESRVMFEYVKQNVIEFTAYGNSGFVKQFDLNYNNYLIANPRYYVCTMDEDSDGVSSNIDLDDDNDGITDIVESGGNNPNGDADGDGLPNYLDTVNNLGTNAVYVGDGSITSYLDSNNDGIPNVYDFDGDGIPNHLDLDSDNDGCPDAIEGSASITSPQLNLNNQISGSVAANGIPVAAGNGQGIGSSQNASLNECNDNDVDGIPNNVDLDDDNDGILDAVEDVCVTKVEGNPVYSNTFGTGTTTSSDSNVLLHTFQASDPQDGTYTVTRSLSQSQTYVRTNLNGDKDAGYATLTSGTTDGRYLMININSTPALNQAIYRIPNLNVLVGTNYRFRIDMAGLADNLGDIPNLQLTIRDNTNAVLATANSSAIGMANDDVWRRLILDFTATTSAISLEIVNLQPNGGNGNDLGIDNIVLAPLFCDNDNDGIPNYYDVDSDNDGCPDAIEGSELVKYNHINPLNSAINPGQIKVTYNGVTVGTPSEIISTSAGANGVPQLVNNAGNNLNTVTNPSNLAGIADNTDIPTPTTSDIGQGIGSSQNSGTSDLECTRCFRPANTATAGIDTTHGITALNRAGASNGNWPMKIKSAYTVMDAKTLGFVVNRLTTTQINAITTAGNAVVGMMVYNTTDNCLKIYDGTGWFCYTRQTCDNFNQ